MKISALFILTVIVCHAANAQQGGVEQYYYLQEKGPLLWMPMVHYQGHKNWWVEARYNYEDLNTISLYAGKVFSKERKLSYSFTPIVGGVIGRFKGASVGLNLNIGYERLFFSAQSQYTFSVEDRKADFFYSWSETGYEIWNWLSVGMAIQQTHLYDTKFELGDPGVVVGFSIGKWEFPLYGFNPFDSNRYFVLGINRTLE